MCAFLQVWNLSTGTRDFALIHPSLRRESELFGLLTSWCCARRLKPVP